MKKIKKIIIASISSNGLIGAGGKMPWNIPDELAHFKETTIGFPVIMGRKTFDSLKRPLIERLNIVLTSKALKDFDNVRFVNSLEKALTIAENSGTKVYIIGGGKVFESAINIADETILSFVRGSFSGDTFFPMDKLGDFSLVKEEPKKGFTVKYFKKS